MKKTFGRKLAFLFVATLLAAGTFTSCADNEEETANTPADSLAKPTGTDPFTTGWYKANITGEGHNYDMYYIFDTAERTVDVQEKREEPSNKMKYTYTANTVTMALYKVAVPSDIDAWVSSWLSDDIYYGSKERKFVDKSELINFVEEVSKKIIPLIEQQLQDTTLSDRTRRELEEDLDYWKNDAIEESKEFDEPAVTYAYTKTGNVITLTNNTATEKIVLTLIND